MADARVDASLEILMQQPHDPSQGPSFFGHDDLVFQTPLVSMKELRAEVEAQVGLP